MLTNFDFVACVDSVMRNLSPLIINKNNLNPSRYP